MAAAARRATVPPRIQVQARPSARHASQNNNNNNNNSKSRRIPWPSILYHISFGFFILLIAALLVGSAWGLGEQAWRTVDGQRRWNIVILVAAYFALGVSAIIHVWSRLLSVKKVLRTMPKPYIPIKNIDVPKNVADHIMGEYTRTAVIAHISQATTGTQEGWGRPGTKWENTHFRTFILDTLPAMRRVLCPPPPQDEHPQAGKKSTKHTVPASPLSLEPLLDAADAVGDKGAVRLFVNSYVRLIDKARFSRREPDELDAAAAEKIVDVVTLTMELKRRREQEDGHRPG